MLVLLGSLSQATQVQAAMLIQKRRVERIEVLIDARVIDGDLADYAAPFSAQVQQAIHSGGAVLVITRVHDLEGLLAMAAQQGHSLAQMTQRVEHLLQAILRPVCRDFAGFIAAGGATANALYHLLEAERLDLETQEVLPGVPMARLRGGPLDGAPFIAKPGSQGSEDALCVLLDTVQRAIHRRETS